MKDQEGSSTERLRALVGRGRWDLCVVWEVSLDKRSPFTWPFLPFAWVV